MHTGVIPWGQSQGSCRRSTAVVEGVVGGEGEDLEEVVVEVEGAGVDSPATRLPKAFPLLLPMVRIHIAWAAAAAAAAVAVVPRSRLGAGRRHFTAGC